VEQITPQKQEASEGEPVGVTPGGPQRRFGMRKHPSAAESECLLQARWDRAAL